MRKVVPLVPDYSHTDHAKPPTRGIQPRPRLARPAKRFLPTNSVASKSSFIGRAQDHDQGTHGASANKDDFSSCWVRVDYPSAGASWGHQFISRIGQEVIVSFLENDIDRPLVTSAIHNGQHTSRAWNTRPT